MTDETQSQEKTATTLKAVYTFMFGRNIYTIRLSDIKKVTLLAHNFIERNNDVDEITKVLYIFSVVGEQISGVAVADEGKPIYETVMEVKAEESDYSTLFKIYEDLIETWDMYLLSTQVK